MEIKVMKTKITGSVDPHGFYTGYASVFGNIDLDGDVIQRGAFKKTIKEKKGRVPIVWFHDPSEPIGLASVEEDDHGLKVEGQLNLKVLRGRDAHALMQQEVMLDHSFGFDTIKEGVEERDGKEVRVLKELKLYEISPLPIGFAANPAAGVEMVKRRGSTSQVVLAGYVPEDYVININVDGNVLDLKDIITADNLASLVARLEPEFKTIVPFQNFPLAEQDRTWDAAAAQRRVIEWATGADDEIDWAKAHRAYVWFDSKNAETIGAHKLPIVDIIGGRPLAVPHAIFNTAARLNQTDVPASDIPGIQNHIGRYYAKMDLTPPWETSSQNEPDKSHSDGTQEPTTSHSTQEEVADMVKAINNLTDDITTLI